MIQINSMCSDLFKRDVTKDVKYGGLSDITGSSSGNVSFTNLSKYNILSLCVKITNKINNASTISCGKYIPFDANVAVKSFDSGNIYVPGMFSNDPSFWTSHFWEIERVMAYD